jgi:ABC-type Mn2+/Zn2+ transport system permease subunit
MVCLASHCRTMRVLGVLVVTALLLAPLEAAVQHVQRDLADGTYAYLFITLSGQQRSPRVLVTI